MANYFNADHLLEWVEKYVKGSITRERERIAKYVRNTGLTRQAMADRILETNEDAKVFRENGPLVKLNDPVSEIDTVQDDWLDSLR
jgi:hypothetical protein